MLKRLEGLTLLNHGVLYDMFSYIVVFIFLFIGIAVFISKNRSWSQADLRFSVARLLWHLISMDLQGRLGSFLLQLQSGYVHLRSRKIYLWLFFLFYWAYLHIQVLYFTYALFRDAR